MKDYKTQALRLRQTGGGIGQETDESNDLDAFPLDGTGEGVEYAHFVSLNMVSFVAPETHLRYYIGADGPGADTPEEAKNLWGTYICLRVVMNLTPRRFVEDICAKFEFFPQLHQLVATRPNVIPICLTTGIGPSGPETIFVQQPDDDRASSAELQRPDTPIDNQVSLQQIIHHMHERNIAIDPSLQHHSVSAGAPRPSLANTGAKAKPKKATKSTPKTPAGRAPKPSVLTGTVSSSKRTSQKKTFDQLLSDNIEYEPFYIISSITCLTASLAVLQP